jgi:tetratricopeptide (TPR) repeat protein
MSNERRHELEKNDLALLLDRFNRAIEPYSTIIAVAVGALLIGSLGWLFFKSQETGQRSDSTLGLIQAVASQDPEVLIEVGQDYPGTPAAAWAKLYQGQLQLSQGIQALYRDREEARGLLEDAKSALESAILESQKSGINDPLLRSRAQLGIARAEESSGNLESAIEAYQKVVAIAESEAIVRQAEQRIEALKDPETKQFLAWFNDQNFAPADPSLPPSMPGLDVLPDLPDMSLTELPGGEPQSGQPTDDGLDLPAADEPAAADSQTDNPVGEP